MRNGPVLPVIAIATAIGLAIIVLLTHGIGGSPLTSLELGGVAWAVGLFVFGVQGLISLASEGEELHPGRSRPRLTDLLSGAIVLFSLGLFALAILLAVGISRDWQTRTIGIFAGIGCLVLATLLMFYKEAFVGDDAQVEPRDDGIPW
ncbi:MAG TPA: hypothetical protein VFL82_06060 [Thermomicrobiales bacterium]|nr:hypothetical protein [Thermomicrobiales bacterium]